MVKEKKSYRVAWVIELKHRDTNGDYFWAFSKACFTREEARLNLKPCYGYSPKTSRIVKYTPGVRQ